MIKVDLSPFNDVLSTSKFDKFYLENAIENNVTQLLESHNDLKNK